MNLIITPPAADLIEEVVSRLEGGERDYSRNLVVFPGKRPAHFLRKKIAGRSGLSFIPPALYSIDDFIDSLSEAWGLPRKLETIDAIALLYEVHQTSSDPLGGGRFVTLDVFFPLGLKIYRDLEELMIEGVSTGQLKNVESMMIEGIPKLTEERLKSLTYFYDAFYKKVDSAGLSTRSQRYQAVSSRIGEAGLDRFDRMIFAGFFALTQAEKRLFRALFPSHQAFFIFQEGAGLKEKLEDLGISSDLQGGSSRKPEIFFYRSPDTHGEVLALGKRLETRMERAGDSTGENMVILLPSSETLFPLVRQALSNLSADSYNVSLGYPLFRTPVFGFFNSLMDLASSLEDERIYIPDYLKFVLHPYTKNIYFKKNSETTRILFHTLEEELLKNRAKTFTTLAEIEANRTLFAETVKKLDRDGSGVTEGLLKEHLAEIHKMTVEKFLAFENIGDFAKKGIDLLVYISNRSPARLHPLFLPFSDSMITALETLSRSMIKELFFQERSGYFIFFRKYIATCYTPFPGTPLKGLQVLGALETRNLAFKTVFVLDANEEVFPGTKKEESLIPFKAREILSLPTYLDRDKLTAYYFDTLLSGAEEVHLFFIDNDKTEKSRFVEKLLWEEEKREKSQKPGPLITPVQYRVDLVNKSPDPIAKSREVAESLKEFTFSATALDRYLKCPIRFYYASVLNLRPKEWMSGNIERNDLGNFVHLVLADYFSGKKGRELKERDLETGEMERLIEARFMEKYGESSTGALYLLKRGIKKHLSDFLEDYTLPLIKEKRVTLLACEERIDVAIPPYRLSGRLDRVERRDDKTVIVDYKTGSNPAYLKIELDRLDIGKRGEWSRIIGSLQLPFYILLYLEKEKREVEALEALYLLLGRSKLGMEIELPLFGERLAKDVFAPLKTVILKLLQEITDPNIPFEPTMDKKSHCPDCDYRYLCGTQWILR